MNWLSALGLLAVLLPCCYMYTVAVVASRFPSLRNKRICLLVAHPDDEAMFFAPTVLALTRPETGNHVKILCLSTGNAEGLGETRKKELVKSALTLGLRKEDDVFVVDSPDFPDSMTASWDAQKISALLCSAFAPGLAKPQSQKKASAANTATAAATATIDVLITFDGGGVSGHPNHISLFHGARAFAAALVRGRPGWASPVDLYTLTSVPLLRKYTGFLDVLATLALWALRTPMKNRSHPAGLVFLAGLAPGSVGLPTAWKAMTTAHASQMVWFRYGWIVFSRYMVMNDLRLEKVKAAVATTISTTTTKA